MQNFVSFSEYMNFNFYNQIYLSIGKEAADLSKKSSSWYDVFNSRSDSHMKKAKCAYGIHLELQNSILTDFSQLVENMLVGNHVNLIDFQYGVITCSNALPMLYIELQFQYQDVIITIATCVKTSLFH